MVQTLPRALDASADAGLGFRALGSGVSYPICGIRVSFRVKVRFRRQSLIYHWCEALKLSSHGLGAKDWSMLGPERVQGCML